MLLQLLLCAAFDVHAADHQMRLMVEPGGGIAPPVPPVWKPLSVPGADGATATRRRPRVGVQTSTREKEVKPVVVLQIPAKIKGAELLFRIDYVKHAIEQTKDDFDHVVLFWADDLAAENSTLKDLKKAFSNLRKGQVVGVDTAAVKSVFQSFFGAQLGAHGREAAISEQNWQRSFPQMPLLVLYNGADGYSTAGQLLKSAPFVWNLEYDVMWAGNLHSILKAYDTSNTDYYTYGFENSNCDDEKNLKSGSTDCGQSNFQFKKLHRSMTQVSGFSPKLLELMLSESLHGKFSDSDTFAATLCAGEEWCHVKDLLSKKTRLALGQQNQFDSVSHVTEPIRIVDVCKADQAVVDKNGGYLFHPVKGNMPTDSLDDCNWVSVHTKEEWMRMRLSKGHHRRLSFLEVDEEDRLLGHGPPHNHLVAVNVLAAAVCILSFFFLPKSSDMNADHDGQRQFIIGIGFMACSGATLLVNKFAVVYLQLPWTIVFCQVAFSALIVRLAHAVGLVQVELLDWTIVREMFPVAVCFVAVVGLSMHILQHASVELMVAARASALLVVCVFEYLLLKSEFPPKESLACLVLAVVGSIAYALFAFDATLSTMIPVSLWWVGTWYGTFCFDQIYTKHVFNEMKLTTWSNVYVVNALACFCMFPFVALEGRNETIMQKGDFSGGSLTLLLSSCVLGVAMAYFSFAARDAFSATSFTLLGNMCNISSIARNGVLMSHAFSLPIAVSLSVAFVSAYGFEKFKWDAKAPTVVERSEKRPLPPEWPFPQSPPIRSDRAGVTASSGVLSIR